MTKRLTFALAALAIASFTLAACGGDDEESSSTTAAESSSIPETGGAGATITAEADPGGGLAWTETSLTGAAGSATLELVNESSTPHNLVIEDEGGSIVAETGTVSADTATADAELEAGTYTFFCDVPGHREAGMEGELTVE